MKPTTSKHYITSNHRYSLCRNAFIWALATIMTLTTLSVNSQEVSQFGGQRAGRYVVVSYDIDFTGVKVKKNQMTVYTPLITDYDGHSVTLPSLIVAGRSQHYFLLRNGGHPEYPDAKEYQAKEAGVINYSESTPYEEWMEGATLSLRQDLCGCGGDIMQQQAVSIPGIGTGTPLQLGAYHPDFAFAFETPAVELRKERELSGRANVEFIVDKWDIVEDYRGNFAEYQKIRQSVEAVKNDPDAQITGIQLKGFASPESPYEHNTMLAQNRVEAIKRYINQLYSIPADIITTSFEPEDWEGLRQFVTGSNIDHKDEILKIIDTDMDLDRKEDQIKRTYPEQYRLMLSTWYPALRHTDYRIQYIVRNYDDPRRCYELVRTAPQKLSLREFFAAAQLFEPGSTEFCEVFETAVRMYPNDPVANLNAVNTALSRGDIGTAMRYIDHIGNDAKCMNARAILLAYQHQFTQAMQLMQRAADNGLPEAQKNIEVIREAQEFLK